MLANTSTQPICNKAINKQLFTNFNSLTLCLSGHKNIGKDLKVIVFLVPFI